MTEQIKRQRGLLPGIFRAPFSLRLGRFRFERARLVPGRALKKRLGGIGLKLCIFTVALIVLVTTGVSLVVVDVMDQVLLRSLIRRGTSIALSAATPAAYSILANDRLALDNLAAKIKQAQDDLVYVAIVDREGIVLAHDQLDQVGTVFSEPRGIALERGENYAVSRIDRGYEFRIPIRFNASRIGTVVLGIDARPLAEARGAARNQILLIALAAVLVGAAGALALSTLMTNPVRRLIGGVIRIRTGDYRVKLPVSSRDELGVLTRSFNEMARVIRSQKEGLESYALELEDSYISTVRILAAALDARDNYTYGHSARVANLALLLGRRLGLSASELKDLEMSCFLHDIGKIRVPDRVLNKKAPLDDGEHRLIRQHPEHGAEILCLAESLHKYIPVVLQHHERHDGRGYPQNLKGEQIHPYARIVSLVDAYDAMTSGRPYRQALSHAAAIEEIRVFSGTQFAPELTEQFIEVLEDADAEKVPSFMGGVA